MRTAENLLRKKLIHANLLNFRSRRAILVVHFECDISDSKWDYTTLVKFFNDSNRRNWCLRFHVKYVETIQSDPEKDAVYTLAVIESDKSYKEVTLTDRLVKELHEIQIHCDGATSSVCATRLRRARLI